MNRKASQAAVACGLGFAAAALLLPTPRELDALVGLAVVAAGLLLRSRDPNGVCNRFSADARAVRGVLDGDGPVMHFQPIVWMPTKEIVGYEGLARFPNPPQRPDQWFDLAERCGLRVELEVAAIREGITALRSTPTDCYISLNLSPDTLLSDQLFELLSEHPGDRIVLELTEHVPIADYDAYLPRIEMLRAQGIRLAVDDAGAGYSSLRHILMLRPEIIKLDRALTTGATDDPVRRALLTCLATFAHTTKTTLIAEGVETVDELDTLIEYGVAFGQGYYFQRPAPLDKLPLGATGMT